jgi:hypothetical protein
MLFNTDFSREPRSFYVGCHSGLDSESSLSELDSRFHGNDGLGINVKKRWTHNTRNLIRPTGI